MNPSVGSVKLSAIIPVGGRQSDLAGLYEDYRRELASLGMSYEVIFVLDGPRPQAAAALQRLKNAGERITVISLTRIFGEATALMAGFERSSGEYIVTLPAYHQIDAVEIRKLVEGLTQSDVCIGRRWPRAGSAFERMRRSAFHGLVSWITKVKVKDLGCNARAFKRQVLEEITLYGDQHRFLAVLADRQGFSVREIDVKQSPRDRYEGYYGPKDYVRRFLDIFTVFFLVRFTKRPLRFFGMIGASMFVAGFAVLLVLVIERLFGGVALADRPALLLSSLLVVLGLQVFALGLLGELVIFTHARHIKDYQVAEIVEAAPSSPTSQRLDEPQLRGEKAEQLPQGFATHGV